jgi:dihydroorotase
MEPLKADLVITGGVIVNELGRVTADLAIKDGRVLAIGAPGTMPPAAETIDATGRFVIPGAIDVHVHFRDPGLEYKEDWASGTAAAAAGGVTTVFDMPNTVPPTDSLAAFALKRRAAEEKAIVNFGIYGLLGEHNLGELESLAGAGAIGFKLFMGNTTGNLPCPSDGAILEGFEILAALGLRCTVHAENSPILFWRENRLKDAGRTDVLAHLAARPDVCALEALSRTIVFAEWTGCRVHIAHESTRRSLPVIKAAKDRGVDITVETCPQYLLLSTDDMLEPGGEVLRVNPPIREPGHQQPLFEALRDGVIDILATDHAPHAPDEKHRASIWDCSCGFPGVETSMRLMLREVDAGRLSLEQYVRMACAAPARAFGLSPRKGVLQVGADADIAIIDPGRSGIIRAEELQSKSKVTPYDGYAFRGAPVMTLVRGAVVMRDGQIVGAPGWGRQVRPSMPPAHPRNQETTTKAITRVAAPAAL